MPQNNSRILLHDGEGIRLYRRLRPKDFAIEIDNPQESLVEKIRVVMAPPRRGDLSFTSYYVPYRDTAVEAEKVYFAMIKADPSMHGWGLFPEMGCILEKEGLRLHYYLFDGEPSENMEEMAVNIPAIVATGLLGRDEQRARAVLSVIPEIYGLTANQGFFTKKPDQQISMLDRIGSTLKNMPRPNFTQGHNMFHRPWPR